MVHLVYCDDKSKDMLSIYTNKIGLQKQLCKILGESTKEYIKGRSIIASRWDVSQ